MIVYKYYSAKYFAINELTMQSDNSTNAIISMMMLIIS